MRGAKKRQTGVKIVRKRVRGRDRERGRGHTPAGAKALRRAQH